MRHVPILFEMLLPCAIISNTAQAQWVQTNGPYGDRVQSVAIADQGNQKVVYAGTWTDGVFRSTDLGENWVSVNAGLPNGGKVMVDALAADGDDLVVGIYDGVYQSTNGGANWVHGASLPQEAWDQQVAGFSLFHGPGGQTNLFTAGSYHGLYLSSNLGMSWSSLNDRVPIWNGDTTIKLVEGVASYTDEEGNTTLIAGGESYYGVVRSTDLGLSWTRCNIYDYVYAVAIVPDSIGRQTLLAGSWSGVKRSTDDGNSWQEIRLGADVRSFTWLPQGTKRTIIFAGSVDDGVHVSTDNGTAWSLKNNGLTNQIVWGVAASAVGATSNILFAATSGGIFRTTDNGEHFIAVNNGMVKASTLSLAVLPDTTGGEILFAGTGASGVFRSPDYGNSWIDVNTGLTSPTVNALAARPDRAGVRELFAGTYEGAFRSSDKGSTWNPVSNYGLTDTHVLGFAVSDTNLFAIIGSGVYRLFNLANNWIPLTALPSGNTPSVLAAYPSAAGHTTLLAIAYERGVYLSTNDGYNWSTFMTGLTTQNAYDFAVSDGRLFLATDDGVFRANEARTSWIHVSDGLTDRAVGQLALAPDRRGGQNLYAVTSSGIFLLSQDDTSWTLIDRGTGSFHPKRPIASGPYFFAVSDNFSSNEYGVWRRPLSEMGVGVETARNEMPAEFRLEQNYPNPFNPTTRICYSVGRVVAPSGASSSGDFPERSREVEGPATNKVRLIVYDLLGREVAVLVNERKAPGSYEVTFDGSGLASGLYLYRLTVGPFVQSRKMILLR
jgi:hypothetical protein